MKLYGTYGVHYLNSSTVGRLTRRVVRCTTEPYRYLRANYSPTKSLVPPPLDSRALRAIIIEPKIGPENRKYKIHSNTEYTQGGIFGYYRISDFDPIIESAFLGFG